MATKVIQQLVTELTADGAKLKKELSQSVKDTESWGNRVGSITKSVTLGLVGIGATAATSLAVLTKASIDNADALDEQSQQINFSVEQLSSLAYQAKFAGIANDELSGSLTKLNKTAADAFKGVGRGAKAFDELGIKVTDTDGKIKDNYTLLGEIADQFAKLEDGPVKTALAMDIFGKSAGPKLVAMLNDGQKGIADFRAEAEQFGKVISTDTGKAAGEFNDNLDKMQAAVDGLGNKLAASALPHLRELTAIAADPSNQKSFGVIATGVLEIGAAALQSIANVTGLNTALQILKSIGAGAGNIVDQVSASEVDKRTKEIADLEERSRMLYGDDFLSNERFKYDPISDDLAKANVELDRYLRLKEKERKEANAPQMPSAGIAGIDEKDLLSGAGSMLDDSWGRYSDNIEKQKAAAKSLADQEKALNSEYLARAEAYRRQQTLTAESTELEKLHFEIAFGSLQGINDKHREALELMAKEADATAAANRKLEERKEIEDLLMTDAERINKVWDERIKKIKELGLSEAEAAELMRKAQTQREAELKKTTDGANKDLSEFSKQAARNMQTAFADFLFDPFEDGLDGLVDSFAKAIQRMAAEAAAAQIFNAVGQWGTSNSSSGGWMGAVAGIASMFGGAYAEGGRPPIGKVSVVGDGGEPELFVPDTAGTIIPFSQLGGGGMSLSIGSMVFPGITNASEAKRAAGAAGRELLGVMSAAQRYA